MKLNRRRSGAPTYMAQRVFLATLLFAGAVLGGSPAESAASMQIPPDAERALPGPEEPRGGLGGGGPQHEVTAAAAAHSCITPLERARVQANVDAYIAAFGEHDANAPYSERSGGMYTFYPMGTNWFDDAQLNNFTDQLTGTGIRDFACSDYTYDGHRGHDNGLRGWGEQDVGVAIFAALAGTVVDAHDGEFDRNTSMGNFPANYVVLNHGGNHFTYYWHMRRGSVAVAIGQVVRAGQQLGLVASSGSSTGPHLHFESWKNNQWFEPHAGSCGPAQSSWMSQLAIDRTFEIFDCGIWPGNPEPAGTQPLLRTGHMSRTEPTVYLWIQVAAIPANTTWRLTYIRPNGTVSYQSTTGNFNNPFYRNSWWYWWYTIPEMRTINGEWRIQLEMNGRVVLTAPVEVRDSRSSTYNRAPFALQSVRFDPPQINPEDVVMARIGTSLTLDDPDYDILRYRYVWTIDGVQVRDFTGAGHADALPAFSASPGQTVRCTVTPSDGRLSAASTSIEYTIPRCIADFNADGGVDGQDIESFFTAFFVADPSADTNVDGGVDGSDIESFYRAWFTGGC